MTAFDILVPLIALAFGLGAAWYARRAGKRFDRSQSRHTSHHPAE